MRNFNKTLYQILTKFSISPSDVGLLNSKVEFIRRLDYLIRNNKKEKTKTTFETQEVHDRLESEINQQHSGKDESQKEHILSEKLDEIRKHKKNHFWMNTGTMKLSTIHSFKGWEIHTLFLIIENEDESNAFGTSELIYTGLTRARVNLFILNLGNEKYDGFFKSYIENCYNI